MQLKFFNVCFVSSVKSQNVPDFEYFIDLTTCFLFWIFNMYIYFSLQTSQYSYSMNLGRQIVIKKIFKSWQNYGVSWLFFLLIKINTYSCLGVWLLLFFKIFFVSKYIKIMFFYFKKFIFKISVSKRSKTHKKINFRNGWLMIPNML